MRFRHVFVPPSYVACPLSRNVSHWDTLLIGDGDREFIINGLSCGFRIVDNVEVIKEVYCTNYKSATTGPIRDEVEKQILEEIAKGNYVVSSQKPPIVSSLGAIIKSSGKVRLIHDCSRPAGLSVNCYAQAFHFKYTTLDKAVSLIPQNGYMAKIDLSSAYRSVPIHPDCFKFTGLSWNFDNAKCATFLVDTRLPFGASTAPGIFQRLSDSITRYMSRSGYNVISYLDDFLIIDAHEDKCQRAFALLLNILQQLGFSINWQKVVKPSQLITFLGVEINSVTESLSLPIEKLNELKSELCLWKVKKKATKKELQQLIGKLNWAARVIRGGRTFLRRIIDIMCTLKRPNHHARLCNSAKEDILWWAKFIGAFNGTAFFIDEDAVPSCAFATDACLAGGGASFYQDWFYCNWAIDMQHIADYHINLKELYTVFLSAKRWAHYWVNKHIVVYTDNTTTMYMINKGTSRNQVAMSWLRELFWLSACFNFHLTARYVPGKYNILSDAISRLDQLAISQWMGILNDYGLNLSNIFSHISAHTFSFLQGLDVPNGRHCKQNVVDIGKLRMLNQLRTPIHPCGIATSDSVCTMVEPLYPPPKPPFNTIWCS